MFLHVRDLKACRFLFCSTTDWYLIFSKRICSSTHSKIILSIKLFFLICSVTLAHDYIRSISFTEWQTMWQHLKTLDHFRSFDTVKSLHQLYNERISTCICLVVHWSSLSPFFLFTQPKIFSIIFSWWDILHWEESQFFTTSMTLDTASHSIHS